MEVQMINEIKKAINTCDPEAEIFLFGSRARSDNHPNSDWDILLLTTIEKITFDYEMNIRDAIVDIELATNSVISLFVYTKKDWYKKESFSFFYDNVQKERIKL